MMKKFKNNKGVTLVALAIAVAVIMILTNVIVYNAIDGLRANKLRNLQTDIENLRDKSIINVYNLSNDARLDKNYIVIVTSNGSIYYTEDIINFYNLNIEGFPKFIISE